MARNRLPDHLFESLRLKHPERFNVYLIGSRLWGTNNSNSDWDILIVGDFPADQLRSLHKSQYDVKLLSREEFINQIRAGSIIEVICYLLDKNEMLQSSFSVGHLQLDIDVIRNWLQDRQARDFEKAEKFWLKENRQAAWKIFRHILLSRALFNHLAEALPRGQITFTLNEIQNIVRPAALVCDKNWLQLDWSEAKLAVIEALTYF